MVVLSQDLKRFITVTLHVGAALTEAELREVLGAIDHAAEALARAGPDAFWTTVVLAETEHGPNATQRKRIGEASRKLARNYQALVTPSAVVRAIMTAIRWFHAPEERKRHETFATYEEARAWLVKRTGHPGEVFDRMLADVRAKVSGTGASPAHP